MTTKRIGFCCKLIADASEINGVSAKSDSKQYNLGTTTATWMRRQSREVAEQRLWDLTEANLNALEKLVTKVGTYDRELRMVRLGSDVLPLYTHAEWREFYRLPDVRLTLESRFARVGELARSADVRLSFHPGQFTVLASDRPDIVTSAIEEVEYHTAMARMMGYGSSWHDCGFKINIHLSGKRGADGFREAFNRLTPEARNLLTVENEENTYGLDSCLGISDIVPVVLDIHHHWVREGEYISPSDERVARVVDSWRGVRPVCHYSVSREGYVPTDLPHVLPDRNRLIEQRINRQKLRAHSDFYWNHAVNDWALGFLDQFDIQCESKAKNLASQQLYEYYRSK